MTNPPTRAGAGELLACPFCGNPPSGPTSLNYGGPQKIWCEGHGDCHAFPMVCEATLEKAIAAWNTRASTPSGAGGELVEVLERAQANWRRVFYPQASDFDKYGCLSPSVAMGAADSIRETLNCFAGERLDSEPSWTPEAYAFTPQANPASSSEAMRRQGLLDEIERLEIELSKSEAGRAALLIRLSALAGQGEG